MTKASKYSHVLDHFKKVDPKIHEVMLKVNLDDWWDDEELTNEKELFLSLVRKIAGQQLSVKAAKSIYKKFSDYFDGEVTTDKILGATDQELRDTGISWAKVKYMKDLATKVVNKEIDLGSLTKLSDEDVIKELVKIKGIGEWTAEMFLMFTLKRENVFSHGDLGLKNGLLKLYKLKSADKKKIEKIVSKWQPYKTFGSISLWHSLDNN